MDQPFVFAGACMLLAIAVLLDPNVRRMLAAYRWRRKARRLRAEEERAAWARTRRRTSVVTVTCAGERADDGAPYPSGQDGLSELPERAIGESA